MLLYLDLILEIQKQFEKYKYNVKCSKINQSFILTIYTYFLSFHIV